MHTSRSPIVAAFVIVSSKNTRQERKPARRPATSPQPRTRNTMDSKDTTPPQRPTPPQDAVVDTRDVPTAANAGAGGGEGSSGHADSTSDSAPPASKRQRRHRRLPERCRTAIVGRHYTLNHVPAPRRRGITARNRIRSTSRPGGHNFSASLAAVCVCVRACVRAMQLAARNLL